MNMKTDKIILNELTIKEQPNNPKVILNKEPKKPREECIGSKATTGCSTSKEKTDIIYVPEQNKFWIVSKSVIDELEEESNTLFTELNTTNGADEKAAKRARMLALQKSGLMNYFKTPELKHFLNDQEKQELIYAENDIKYAREAAYKEFEMERSPVETINFLYRLRDVYFYKFYEMTTNSTIEDLMNTATIKAQAKGYIVDNGELYTPEQIKIHELIKKYLSAREEAQKLERTRVKDGEVADAYESLDRLSKEYNDFREMGLSEEAIHRMPKYAKRIKTLKDYETSILELASYGIAIPEYALTKKGEILKAGIQKYFYYRNNLQEFQNAKDALQKEFESWLKSAHMAPPKDTFKPHIDRISALENKLESYRLQAETNVASFDTPKLLLWEAEQQKPLQASTLIEDSMPLREYTKPEPKIKVLKQFNINKLMTKTQQGIATAQKFLKMEGEKGKATYSIKDLNSENDIFSQYLEETNAKEITIKEEWYEEGIFQPDRFFEYLDKSNHQIDTLKDPEERKRWGSLLQAIILEDQIKRKVTTFDSSAGGIMVRTIGSFYNEKRANNKSKNLYNLYNYLPSLEFAGSFEVEGPSFDSASGSFKSTLGVSLFHGRAKLLDLYSPPQKNGQINPIHLEIDYKDWQGNIKKADFGHFFFKLEAEATGFAGASIMLNANATLIGDQQGITLRSSDHYEERGINTNGTSVTVEGSLFAGASMGIMGTCNVNWCPPKAVTYQYENYYKTIDITNKASYKILTQLKLGVAGLAGVGAMCNFSIGIVHNRFRITFGYGISFKFGIEQSVSFDLDMGGAYQIIKIVINAIKENDYMPISFVTDDAMNVICKILIIGVVDTLAYTTALTVDMIEKLYNLFSSEQTGLVGYHMANNKKDFTPWLKDIPPQGLGVLFYLFTQPIEDLELDKGTSGTTIVNKYEVLVCQQEAVVMCLQEITSRNKAGETFNTDVPCTAQAIFEEVILRMHSPDGVFYTDRAAWLKDNVEQDSALLDNYCANLDKLTQLMERVPFSAGSQALKFRYDKALELYNDLIPNLNKRMRQGCNATGDYYDKFMHGRALRLERLHQQRPISDGSA